MGLLSALKLPRPQHWPAEEPAQSPKTAPRLASVARQGEPVAAGIPSPEGDEEEPTRVVQRGDAANEAPAEAEAEGQADGEANLEATTGKAAASGKPTTTEEVGYGDFSLGLKESADGSSLVVKWEHKQKVAQQDFKVWVIPCSIKAHLKIGVEGEIVIKGKGDRQLAVKAGGSLALEVGSMKGVHAGPYGEVALMASTKVPTRLSEAREIAMNPFVVDIHGTGKVGVKFEIEDSWMRNSDCELVNWHLFVVHVGAYANGSFGPIRVEPGKDMQRLIAALQQVGPAIADAVEKYAPEKVKQMAEDGAKWVAESDEAKVIADGTEVVLDKVKKETGVDIGGGAEKVVQVLVDPGGETSQEATERVQKDMAELNASHGEFQEVMLRSGLLTEFNNTLYRTAEEYNAIVDAKDKGGDWRSMVVALVAKCRAKKEAYLREQAEKKRREKEEAAAKAAAELARRVKESEAAMNAALTAANMLGNPLNNRTQGQAGSKARKYWETGMNKYWSPGSAARLQCASLQGEAKIAKAQEATALLVKARAVFQEGMRMIE